MNDGPADAPFCIECGERLEQTHRFCPACGARRWRPEPEAAPAPAGVSPGPAWAPGIARPAGTGKPPRALPWFFAGGAVLWLISAAQAAAMVASSTGRAQMAQQLAAGGMTRVSDASVVALGAGQLAFCVLAAGFHAVAFYGLRARRRWGWLAAVLLAGLWSLVLVGIPLLVILLRPATRRAYGID
jgi:hypothetical protein